MSRLPQFLAIDSVLTGNMSPAQLKELAQRFLGKQA